MLFTHGALDKNYEMVPNSGTKRANVKKLGQTVEQNVFFATN
jgi:hypothetical protein